MVSSWGLMAGREEALSDPTTGEALKFWRHFRVLFPFFEELVEVKSRVWNDRGTADANGFPAVPMQLKVGIPASRRCVGKG
ncbi:unnamed protein product [Discosporangium mesarthrocarpum]